MQKIKSFTIDHDYHIPGIYLSSVNNDIYTYDVRFSFPNHNKYTSVESLHSIEHMLATVMRNNDQFAKSVIYVGPMGCRTGFYIILRNVKIKEATRFILDSFKDCLTLKSLPGNDRKSCGNYLEHNFKQAKKDIKTFLSFVEEPKNYYAVIDIGSNSVRLEISVNQTLLSKEILSTGLSRGMRKSGMLSKESMSKTAEAVKAFYQKAQSFSPKEIVVFGTQALREAKNANSFIELLAKNNIPLRILSAEEETKLAFLSVSSKLPFAVLDVGGASTELVVAESSKILFSHSFPFGVVTATDLHDKNVDKIQNYCLKYLEKEKANIPSFNTLYLIGGSASTFAAVDLQLDDFFFALVDNYTLSSKNLEKILKSILIKIENDSLNIPGLPKDRVPTVVASAAIILTFFKFLNKKNGVVKETNTYQSLLRLSC